jgi:hypothetical protein
MERTFDEKSVFTGNNNAFCGVPDAIARTWRMFAR